MKMSNLCPVCNEGTLSQRRESRDVNYKTHRGKIDFFYSECDECGSEVAGTKDLTLNKRAMIAFQKSVDGLISSEEIKALRDKYQLTQARAGLVFGGGEKAFSKYESNDVAPSEAMSTLLRICLRNRVCIEEVLAVKKLESQGRLARLANEIERSKKEYLIAKRNIFAHQIIRDVYSEYDRFEKLVASSNKKHFGINGLISFEFGSKDPSLPDLQDFPLDWS